MSGHNPGAGGATVLVVDDEEDIVTYLQAVLQDNGFRAVSAVDAASAQQEIRHQPPDLILLDIMMPGQSGLFLYRKLKESPDTARIPVLFISGCPEPGKADRLHVDPRFHPEHEDPMNYFEKPIVVPRLLRRIEQLIGSRGEETSSGRH